MMQLNMLINCQFYAAKNATKYKHRGEAYLYTTCDTKMNGCDLNQVNRKIKNCKKV